MNRTTTALVLAALLAGPALARAEALPPELNLIPREAGMFVSVRVADLWEDARIKPLREFLTKDADLLRDFERKNGFRPDDVERVTVLIPGFDGRYGPSEPCLVLTFKKPVDLARLLDAWEGLSPAEFRLRLEKQQTPAPWGRLPVKKGEFGPPPKFIEKDLPPPPPPKDFFPKGESPVLFLQDDPPAKRDAKRDLKASYYMLQRRGGFLIPINERTVFVAEGGGFRGNDSVHDLLAALLRRADGEGTLSKPLEAAAGKHAVVVGVNLPAIRNAIPDGSPVRALPLHTLLHSRSATVTFDAGAEPKLAVRVDCPDEKTAKRAGEVLKAFHVLGMESLAGAKELMGDDSYVGLITTLVEPVLANAEFSQEGASASITMKGKIDEAVTASVLKALEKVKEAAERARQQNNLKQIGLAVHNYHDAMGRFPFPGVSAPKGNPVGGVPDPKPKLSWRVAILPYIEQQNLYTQFRFDEPWDSEHNKKLIPMIPKIYAPPPGVDAPKGNTFLRTFTGQGTFGTAQTFANITDGTANTIMVLEAGESVPWTKPDEMPLGEKLPKLGGHFKGKMNVLMGDGSVRTIDLSRISEATLRAAITTQGGEVLGSDW